MMPEVDAKVLDAQAYVANVDDAQVYGTQVAITPLVDAKVLDAYAYVGVLFARAYVLDP